MKDCFMKEIYYLKEIYYFQAGPEKEASKSR